MCQHRIFEEDCSVTFCLKMLHVQRIVPLRTSESFAGSGFSIQDNPFKLRSTPLLGSHNTLSLSDAPDENPLFCEAYILRRTQSSYHSRNPKVVSISSPRHLYNTLCPVSCPVPHTARIRISNFHSGHDPSIPPPRYSVFEASRNSAQSSFPSFPPFSPSSCSSKSITSFHHIFFNG